MAAESARPVLRETKETDTKTVEDNPVDGLTLVPKEAKELMDKCELPLFLDRISIEPPHSKSAIQARSQIHAWAEIRGLVSLTERKASAFIMKCDKCKKRFEVDLPSNFFEYDPFETWHDVANILYGVIVCKWPCTRDDCGGGFSSRNTSIVRYKYVSTNNMRVLSPGSPYKTKIRKHTTPFSVWHRHSKSPMKHSARLKQHVQHVVQCERELSELRIKVAHAESALELARTKLASFC